VDTEWVSLFCRIIHAPLRARASVSLDEASALGHLDDIFGLLPRQKVLRSRGEDFISAIAGNKVDIGGARNDGMAEPPQSQWLDLLIKSSE
jgi:hypothetical protein